MVVVYFVLRGLSPRNTKSLRFKTTQHIGTFEGHVRETAAIALNLDERTWVSSGIDRTVWLWESSLLSAS